MQLITAEAVKAYWLKGIVEPARMSADEYKIKAANESKRNAINTGQYDGLAQDEANRLNIDLLRQNGDVQAANTLQESRDAYAAQVAAARQRAEQKQQMDDFTASLRSEMFLQRVEMQRQTQELQNISRQLRR